MITTILVSLLILWCLWAAYAAQRNASDCALNEHEYAYAATFFVVACTLAHLVFVR